MRGTCPPSKTKLHNGFQPLHERCEGRCGLKGEVWVVREVWGVRGGVGCERGVGSEGRCGL